MRICDKTAALFVSSLVKIMRKAGLGGTSLPGKLGLKINKNLLRYLSEGRKIIVVTGTNGKTTTARMIGHMLNSCNKTCKANRSGANLLSGITTTLAEHRKSRAEYFLLEIDEAAFCEAASHFTPEAVVVTNFFRDQLDRYGELYSTLDKVKKGISKIPKTVLVLNADDPLCASIGKKYPNRKIYYGFSHKAGILRDTATPSDSVYCIYCKTRYVYEYNTIGHLGRFSCPGCGYSRPKAEVEAASIDRENSGSTEITISNGDKEYMTEVNLPARYNVYNALAAFALSQAIGLDAEVSARSLKTFEGGFGRMETLKAGDKYISLLLVKNPAGFNSSLEYLGSVTDKAAVCFAINDNTADGRDISWLWDVNFEALDKTNVRYICSGKRAYDMALRLKYAGMPQDRIEVISDYRQMLETGLGMVREGNVFRILPTYTAMLDIRAILQKQYDLKEIWR